MAIPPTAKAVGILATRFMNTTIPEMPSFINATAIQDHTVSFASTSIHWFMDKPIFAGVVLSVILLGFVIIGKQILDTEETFFQTLLFSFAIYMLIIIGLLALLILVDSGEVVLWNM